MPKPTPGHMRLEAFVGAWSGEEEMYPSQWDPKGGVAEATLTNVVACDGFWVTGDYEQRRGGEVTFRGHSVMGYEPKSDEVLMYWFDSMGMGMEVFRGTFDGDRLTLTSKGPMGFNRMGYDFNEKGTLRSRMEMSQDGKQWKTLFEGVYHLRR